MSSTKQKPSPIEIWLRKRNMEVTGMIVFENERAKPLSVESLSIRGAQREVTGRYINYGYKPIGRWVDQLETAADEYGETMRRFKLA